MVSFPFPGFGQAPAASGHGGGFDAGHSGAAAPMRGRPVCLPLEGTQDARVRAAGAAGRRRGGGRGGRSLGAEREGGTPNSEASERLTMLSIVQVLERDFAHAEQEAGAGCSLSWCVKSLLTEQVAVPVGASGARAQTVTRAPGVRGRFARGSLRRGSGARTRVWTPCTGASPWRSRSRASAARSALSSNGLLV